MEWNKDSIPLFGQFMMEWKKLIQQESTKQQEKVEETQ